MLFYSLASHDSAAVKLASASFCFLIFLVLLGRKTGGSRWAPDQGDPIEPRRPCMIQRGMMQMRLTQTCFLIVMYIGSFLVLNLNPLQSKFVPVNYMSNRWTIRSSVVFFCVMKILLMVAFILLLCWMWNTLEFWVGCARMILLSNFLWAGFVNVITVNSNLTCLSNVT
jgi:hypothetical protein